VYLLFSKFQQLAVDCGDDCEHMRGIGHVAFRLWVVDDCPWLGYKQGVKLGRGFESVFSELNCAIKHQKSGALRHDIVLI
jgi:hypothetical protein